MGIGEVYARCKARRPGTDCAGRHLGDPGIRTGKPARRRPGVFGMVYARAAGFGVCDIGVDCRDAGGAAPGVASAPQEAPKASVVGLD